VHAGGDDRSPLAGLSGFQNAFTGMLGSKMYHYTTGERI